MYDFSVTLENKQISILNLNTEGQGIVLYLIQWMKMIDCAESNVKHVPSRMALQRGSVKDESKIP